MGSGLLGQLLAKLPIEERAQRYREMAAQILGKAHGEPDPDRRAEYIAMASGWHTLAQEAERFFGADQPLKAKN